MPKERVSVARGGEVMLTFHSIPNSNIVEFTLDGAVTREDFDAVIAEVNSKIADYGSVDVLEEIRSIGKMSPSVIWDDLRWALSNMRHVGRAAVVCDKKWIEKMVDVMQPLTRVDVRHFVPAEIGRARQWLVNGID
ncbi:MAG: STAS/SEC14 domain-containing protein [Woeseia sp.]